MVIGDDPVPGEGNSTVKYIYYNQLAPAPSSTSLLNQLPASEPVSRTNSHGRRDQNVPENSGLVTYRIRNSAGDQTRSVSFENVLGPGEGVSSEGGMSDKPGYLQLSVSRDLDSSTDLLNSSIARLSDLADYQIFSQVWSFQIVLSNKAMTESINCRDDIFNSARNHTFLDKHNIVHTKLGDITFLWPRSRNRVVALV